MSTPQWLIVVFLALVAALLAANLFVTPEPAEAQTGSRSATGQSELFAVAGQLARDTYGLYLVDQRNGTICVYQFSGDQRKVPKLRFVAARTFIYDRQLDSYNTEPPPKDVAKLVAEARRLTKVAPEP